jgi:L-threonylcarbamoyladenylate synthase
MVVPADSPDALPMLREALGSGGVAVVPCDTIYGLVGIAPDTEARIRGIKGRGEDKPFLQLVADRAWARRLASRAPSSLEKYWPGPLTLILPARAGGTIALRVPSSPFLRDLIKGLGRPLYSTSVNRAGQAPLWRIEEIVAGFEAAVDLVLDAGDLPEASPSTIVDATSRPFRVVRQGSIVVPLQELL